MDIYGYVTRLETVLRSRKNIEVEMLTIRWTGSGAKLRGEVRFCDNSRLSFFEMIQEVGKRKIRHTKYRFHYQDAGENLIFRYDNAPHHPHLSTFPDHKHVGNTVAEAAPPDLNDVLAEVDGIIYKEKGSEKL